MVQRSGTPQVFLFLGTVPLPYLGTRKIQALPPLYLRISTGSCFSPAEPFSLEVGVLPLTLGPETHCLLILRQEWKQAVAELMVCMQEKWPTVAGEPSQACCNILQKLKWHKITKSELLATHGYMEDLQQVRRLDRRCRAPLSSDSQHALLYRAQH